MNLIRNLDSPLTSTLRSAPKGEGKRETSELCRERAAADLLESAAMINANQRLRLETSAASWTQRADMLQRVEDGTARRTAEAAAARPAASEEPGAEPARHASP